MSTKDNKAIIDDMTSRMTPLLSIDKNGDNQEDKKNRVLTSLCCSMNECALAPWAFRAAAMKLLR